MTKAEIQKHIERLVNGRAATSDAHQIELIDLGLSKYRAMLAAFEKKSNPQPSEKPEQLPQMYQPTTPKEKEEARFHKYMEDQIQNQHRDKTESVKAFEVKENRVTVGHVTEAPVINIPSVFIKIGGEDKLLSRTEIIGYLKTYFKRIAMHDKMSAGLYSELYGSEMGKTIYKLFQGWNMIYNETKEGAAWPPLEDVFPGLSRASQQHKVNADVLWRWASNDK